jgi:hypothetical protein
MKNKPHESGREENITAKIGGSMFRMPAMIHNDW